MNYLNQVKKTTKFVLKNSKNVKIKKEAFEDIYQLFKKKKFKQKHSFEKYHFLGSFEKTANYFFIVDSLNFSFFAKKGKKKWKINKVGGYFGLALSLKKNIEKISDLDFLLNIKEKDLKEILGNIPLFKERMKILRENSKILKEKFSGKVSNLIKLSEFSCQKLIEILVNNFPTFRDFAFYKKKKIWFLKRAQIFCLDLYLAIKKLKLKRNFSDIDKLTAFADYKIPQILNNFGVLEYSDKLLKIIKEKKEIKAGSKNEVEIRANTIWAVEFLKEFLKRKGKKLKSFEIDNLLWDIAKTIKMEIPHHITRTIFY